MVAARRCSSCAFSFDVGCGRRHRSGRGEAKKAMATMQAESISSYYQEGVGLPSKQTFALLTQLPCEFT